jgi:hypothetical protein
MPTLTTSLKILLNNRTEVFIVHQLITITPTINALRNTTQRT